MITPLKTDDNLPRDDHESYIFQRHVFMVPTNMIQMGEGLIATDLVIGEAIEAVLTNEGTLRIVHHEG